MEALPIKHKFKNNSLKLTIPLNKLIHKGYRFDVVVRTLKRFYWHRYFYSYHYFT